MNHLERADAKFIEAATDDSLRQAAIKRYTTARNRMFLCVIVTTVASLVGIFAAAIDHNANGGVVGFMALGPALLCISFMQHESNLRLLLLADKLKKIEL